MENEGIFSLFKKGEPIIIEGYLLKDGKRKSAAGTGYHSIQIFPGFIIEIKKEDAKLIEQATDPVTGRTFIRLTLSPDAELTSVFQIKLARLALSAGEKGIPFSFGNAFGEPVYVEPPTLNLGSITTAAPNAPGGGGGHWDPYETACIGETDSYSKNLYTGPKTKDDRTPYTDTITDWRWIA